MKKRSPGLKPRAGAGRAARSVERRVDSGLSLLARASRLSPQLSDSCRASCLAIFACWIAVPCFNDALRAFGSFGSFGSLPKKR